MTKKVLLLGILVLLVIGLVGCAETTSPVLDQDDSDDSSGSSPEEVSDEFEGQVASEDDVEIGEMI